MVDRAAQRFALRSTRRWVTVLEMRNDDCGIRNARRSAIPGRPKHRPSSAPKGRLAIGYRLSATMPQGFALRRRYGPVLGVTSVLTLFFAVESGRPAQAETVTIAAAADLTYCIEELDRIYLQSHPGTELKVSTGSSGNFSAQIQSGAPFDVFLSADIQYPKKLDGFVDESSLTVYAIGQIVLWTTKPESVNLDRGLEVLLDRSAVKKIAIANPEHAPYGRAAKAVLEKKGLWSVVQDRIVQGENISQTAQYVQTGNADAGFVALSLVLAPNLKSLGRYIEIDPNLYPKLEQAMVLTTAGSKREVVRDYFQFLQSTAARKIFDHFGFTLPTPNG
jgi:molybdate transport system substrate-binding protein